MIYKNSEKKLKDDIFKKLKSVLSGSNEAIKESSTEKLENSKSSDEELINNFMKQILDAAWVEQDLISTSAPSYHLSKKEKSYWLMNVQLKTFTYIKGGIEIIPIEQREKETICLIGASTYAIPNNLLVCSGWN